MTYFYDAPGSLNRSVNFKRFDNITGLLLRHIVALVIAEDFKIISDDDISAEPLIIEIQ